jgi:4-hydroxy-tetrahydrodipicolinate reductase
MVQIIIHGCSGRMGRVLASMAMVNPDCKIVAGVDPAAKTEEFPFPVFPTLSKCELAADVIIDFSAPEALKELLDGAVQKNIPLIIATTGHTEENRALIKAQAEEIPIFQAPNMSLGINLMLELIQKAATVIGDTFDIEIVERHHNLKKDAPSGTAYAIADAINEVFIKSKSYVFGKYTNTEQRKSDEIGIHAVRGGTIVGDHQVLFAGKDEVLEIKHSAYSRQIYAAGALQAAQFLKDKPPGYYSMKDMITERSTIAHMYTREDEALVSIYGIPHDPKPITALFRKIGEENINLDMISQTAVVDEKVNISFTLPRQDVKRTVALLKGFQVSIPELQFAVFPDITKITVEGSGMETQSGVAAQVFQVMANQEIALKTITTSETKISYIIAQKDTRRAVEAIKKAFGI